jgi:hypothetical protein
MPEYIDAYGFIFIAAGQCCYFDFLVVHAKEKLPLRIFSNYSCRFFFGVAFNMLLFLRD